MKTVFALFMWLTTASLTADEQTPYRLTLEPQSPPTIPTVELPLTAVVESTTGPVKDSVSPRMMKVIRVVSQTQRLLRQYDALKLQVSGKTWKNLTPEQRDTASAAATLAGQLQKEVTALRGEVGSCPDPSRVINYIIDAELAIQAYDELFSALLQREYNTPAALPSR